MEHFVTLLKVQTDHLRLLSNRLEQPMNSKQVASIYDSGIALSTYFDLPGARQWKGENGHDFQNVYLHRMTADVSHLSCFESFL